MSESNTMKLIGYTDNHTSEHGFRNSLSTSPIDVVFITDENYAIPTLVACNSIIKNKKSREKVNIHVLAVGLGELTHERFRLLGSDDVVINLIADGNDLGYLATPHPHVSPAALLKFRLPEIFPHLDRILYLDGDILVLGDLTEFYSVDIYGKYAAVVKDMAATIDEGHHLKHRHKNYFNSGVMLLNLEKFRSDGVPDKLISLKAGKTFKHFMDQDELNAILSENVIYAQPSYNLMKKNLKHGVEDTALFYGIKLDDMLAIYQSPLILHLTNSPKTWLTPEEADFELWASYLPQNAYVQYIKKINSHFDGAISTLSCRLNAIESEVVVQRNLAVQANERANHAVAEAAQAQAREDEVRQQAGQQLQAQQAAAAQQAGRLQAQIAEAQQRHEAHEAQQQNALAELRQQLEAQRAQAQAREDEIRQQAGQQLQAQQATAAQQAGRLQAQIATLQEGINQQASYAQALVERIVAMQSTWWWRISMLWRRPSKWLPLPTPLSTQRQRLGTQNSALFATDQSGTFANTTNDEPHKAPPPLVGEVGRGMQEPDSHPLFPSPTRPANGEGAAFEAPRSETSAAAPTLNEKQSNPIFSHVLPIVKLAMPIQHITELFALDGRLFITESYRNLLRREPDEHGMAYYLGRLAQGHGKAAVIAQLAQSTECRPWDEIKGLNKLIADERSAQHWFLGMFGQRQRLERKLQSGLNGFGDLNAGVSRIGHRLEAIEDGLMIQTQQMDSLVQQVGQKIGVLRHPQEFENFQSQQIKHSEENDVFLGRSNQRFIFNLTTSHHWRAHPVGIIRVERELAKYLSRYKNVKYVIWDGEFGVLRELANWQVGNILSDQWCDSNNKLLSQYHLASLSTIEISAGDTFVSVGLDWDLSPVHEIAKYLKEYGTKMVGGCHDTVPILFPEFTVRSGMDQLFRRHFIDMAHTTTFVWTNSDTSSRDLINFWIDSEIETCFPKIKTIQLGAADRPSELPHLSENDVNILQHTLSLGDYVLYVSSLESRKNHRLLVNIWRELHRSRGLACPRLIFVGMRGWGVDDLLNQIARMPAFKSDKITWLENVSDPLLSHLYAHSMFTVFPSMYEGWGLAATEALSYGKICVVADNSALPQASQGLMPKYHPQDYFGWLSEISRLIDDSTYRSDLEHKISENYVARTWEDFSREFCRQILSEI